MANPSYEEVRANPAYASVPDEQLKAAYAKKFGAAQAAPAPSMMDRLKSFATNPTVLKTVGTTAGLALAPEATIPAMLLAGVGSVGGGLASNIARGEAPESLGHMAGDFAEGAVAPVAGMAMKGGAAALRAAGKVIPKNIGFYGALSGHPSMLALRAAVAESGLPRLMDFAGENYNKVIKAVQGSLRSAAPEAEGAVDPIVARTRALANKATGKSVEQNYRMPGGSPEPYQPRGFKQSLESLRNEPGPSAPQVVPPAAPAAQVRPSMADVDELTNGINSRVPTSRAKLAQLAGPKAAPAPAPAASVSASPAMASLQQAVGNGSRNVPGMLPYSSTFPYPMWGAMAPQGALPTEMLPQEIEQVMAKAVPAAERNFPVMKVPMGRSGSEYVTAAGEKIQPYGPSTKLSAEEEAAAPEFWDRLMQLYSRQP